MARLIDADALKESVRKKFAVLSDRCEINELVNAAPTIDVIPVEWLQNEADRQKDMGEWADADVIYWLIQTWQKEQEAR